ncbi:MAG: NADH-ubiquinone oxidoreductase-F iron-sulfur binding region domain-containing protein [Bacteroidales bacterium]|nr:NADH-ubiquinone oxidoreductase-F iron-sulfur binding region domain-containing protein [Bacteroidales bacterium]MDD3665341.1 NADH-ubiquinone oxidoreductase-F iron-sulfur binding region domain-containing protein [Bacteroidales bacterium]
MESNKLSRVDYIFRPESNRIDLIKKIMSKDKDDFILELIDSGLKGRGGAGFLTGLKWKLAKEAQGDKKYVICNADEGEPGTFKDREILDRVAGKVLTGMALCGYIVGANEGFIYLRAEYRFLAPKLQQMMDAMNQELKTAGLDFTLALRFGSGAYVCGEETALIESMEGKRGEPRNKPPFPVTDGYLGKPTVVNNVETFVNTVIIAEIGYQEYKKLGTDSSRGMKLFSISGDCAKEGIFELELGMSLADFVEEFGDGDTKAVQVGGASGFCVPRKKFKETIIGFEGIPTGGSMKIFNSSRSMYNVLHNYLDFFQEESCGQCTPCRVGCQQLLKGIMAVKRRERPATYLDELVKLAETMRYASKCGLGQSVGNAFVSIVENFREEIVY